MKVNLPDRVAFVNVKTEQVFFDCDSFEARKAIEVIKDIRNNKNISSAVDNIENRLELDRRAKKKKSIKQSIVDEFLNFQYDSRVVVKTIHDVVHNVEYVVEKNIMAVAYAISLRDASVNMVIEGSKVSCRLFSEYLMTETNMTLSMLIEFLLKASDNNKLYEVHLIVKDGIDVSCSVVLVEYFQ